MKETVKVKLTTVTPVFIGSGEKYTACELVKKDSSYYRLRERSFFKLLHDYPKLSTGDSMKKIANQTVQNLERIITKDDLSYELKNYVGTIEGEILQLLKHPSGAVYIPGSSIKGAIRTAIQYCIMKKNKDHFQKLVLDALKEAQPGRRPNFAEVTRKLDRALRLPGQDLRTDLARFLLVSDTNLLKIPICLAQVGIFKIKSGKLELDTRKAKFLMEFIGPKIEFETEITFDKDQMELMQEKLSQRYSYVPSSIKEVLNCVREMYQDVIEDELRDLTQEKAKYGELLQELKGEPDKLHIGYGGGLKACSLFILLDEQLRKQVRNTIRYHGNDIAPLSRRSLTQDAIPISPFGWFTFKVVQ
ncbi:MAG: type III-A CRISPR-associated RAMP protein Csm5 [Pseudothermotoga sp.]